MKHAAPARSLAGALGVAAATLAALLPFSHKALHIDDHRYLRMAQQILRDPGDFYGFDVNFGSASVPAAAVLNNPPGGGFYLALAMLATGESETGLHLAFLLPALAATLASFALARGLGGDPRLAGLTCLACPVFLVSATTLMADVPMTALFCGSVACWVHGFARGRPRYRLAAAILASLCALTKYFGMALIPLLFAHGLLRERRLGGWALPLLLPVAALGAYELYTSHVYGVSAITSAAGWAVTTRSEETGRFERLLAGALFAGGALAPGLGFAVVGFSRRLWGASLALAGGLLALALAHGRLAGLPLRGEGALDLGLLLHLGVFALAAGVLAVLAVADLARRADADAWLLALWCGGTFVFATLVNYTTNGRTLLPLAPAVAVLWARRLEAQGVAPLWRYAPLLPAIALSLAVAWGDAALADASRQAALRLGAAHADRPGTLWFEGGWGLQHYLGAAGGRVVDVRRDVLRPGDWLVSSDNLTRPLALSPRAAREVETFDVSLPPVSTMLRATGTGFYAIQWGPLPYRFAAGARERFTLRRIEQFQVFESDPAEVARRTRELEAASREQALLRALDQAGWPLPPGEDRDAAARARCAPRLHELAGRSARECGWCASPQPCESCRRALAEQLALPPDCRAGLEAARRDAERRCAGALSDEGGATGDPLCRAARTDYRRGLALP